MKAQLANQISTQTQTQTQTSGSAADLNLPPMIRELHAKALAAAARFKSAEIELLQVLEEVGLHRAFLRYGYNSLFQYAVKALGLSESVAFVFINVARKASEIPELKKEIADGALSVSKAKKITGVITRENSAAWIELAKKSSQQKLEREVSLANPGESGRGRMSYVPAQIEVAEKVVVQTSEVSRSVAPARVQLEVGISEKLMIKIRRAQGLLSQRVRRGATLEETLEAMVDVYLSKHDPTERAKRQLLRGKLNDEQVLRPAAEMGASNASNEKTARNKMTASKPVTASRESSVSRKSTARKQSGGGVQTSVPVQASKRRPLAAATKHRVFLKFGARCSHINNQGERCSENKFLEVHHVKPLHLGGDDRLENLTLLCSGHHRGVHLGWSVAADPQ